MAQQTALDRPDLDGRYQLAALEQVRADVAGLRANYRELASWLAGWQALLDQAIAEATLGLAEGEDEARRAYFLLAEGLAQAAALTLARSTYGPAAGLESRLTAWPAFDNHLRGWQALRALRQVLGWSGPARGLVTGAPPILVLSPEGESRLRELTVDLLLVPAIGFGEASRRLEQLSWGWTWRA